MNRSSRGPEEVKQFIVGVLVMNWREKAFLMAKGDKQLKLATEKISCTNEKGTFKTVLTLKKRPHVDYTPSMCELLFSQIKKFQAYRRQKMLSWTKQN